MTFFHRALEAETAGPWPVALALPSALLLLFLSAVVMTTEQRYQLVFLEYLLLFAGLVANELGNRRPSAPVSAV